MERKRRFVDSSQGFTLLEMLVVIALVGVLTSIALPNYGNLVMRARKTEAKLSLSAIFTAEIAARSVGGSFTSCLADIGFVPDGSARYFRVGFTTSGAGGGFCGPDGASSCLQFWAEGGVALPCTVGPKMDAGFPYVYPATAILPGAGTLPTDALMPVTNVTQDTFTAAAGSGLPQEVAWLNWGLGETAYAVETGPCSNYFSFTINESKVISPMVANPNGPLCSPLPPTPVT